ncbi:MAG TPA: nuclear transport factor 2 family protein [Cyclobacteriaceae bacterium]|nr:nuclear transport factor 2 family protein [Cyclobacteriaceae bacterium]
MDQISLITEFYTAFAAHDYKRMAACYHDEIEFHDPAFGTLKGDQAKAMWKMLIERSEGKLKVVFSNVTSSSAHWEAFYLFSKTGRNVHNKIDAQFEFKDGKIIRHHDHFNLWAWSRQAMGISGLLLGYTSFFRNKLQAQTRKLLSDYMQRSK